MHSALKNKLYADARTATELITALPPSRAVEALVALLMGTLSLYLFLDKEAERQLHAEMTNFVFLARKRDRLTSSFVFWRFLRTVQNLIRDGLAFPRREIAGGLLLEEDEALDALLSSLAVKSKEECLDTFSVSGHKPRRRGARHKAAERALILALRDRHGKRNCPDKLKQRELFQLAA